MYKVRHQNNNDVSSDGVALCNFVSGMQLWNQLKGILSTLYYPSMNYNVAWFYVSKVHKLAF